MGVRVVTVAAAWGVDHGLVVVRPGQCSIPWLRGVPLLGQRTIRVLAGRDPGSRIGDRTFPVEEHDVPKVRHGWRRCHQLTRRPADLGVQRSWGPGQAARRAWRRVVVATRSSHGPSSPGYARSTLSHWGLWPVPAASCLGAAPRRHHSTGTRAGSRRGHGDRLRPWPRSSDGVTTTGCQADRAGGLRLPVAARPAGAATLLPPLAMTAVEPQPRLLSRQWVTGLYAS